LVGSLDAPHHPPKHIPIVALTAHAMTGDREGTMAAGCNHFDTKPVDLPRLLAKITALTSRVPGSHLDASKS
jgi:CheY-like chemotaxis protein